MIVVLMELPSSSSAKHSYQYLFDDQPDIDIYTCWPRPVGANSVYLEHSDTSLCIVVPLHPFPMEIEFDFVQGLTRLNSELFFGSSSYVSPFTRNLFMSSYLRYFDNPNFQADVISIIPANAQPPTQWGTPHGFFYLVMGNRFRGYPIEFYRQMEERIFFSDDIFLERCLDKWRYVLDFPVSYRDIDGVYLKTGLPNNQSLQRMLLDDLFLLAEVANCALLPFRDEDVLVCFMGSRKVHEYLREFRDRYVCRLWWIMARLKGDRAVFEYLEGLSLENLQALNRALLIYGGIREEVLSDSAIHILKGLSVSDAFLEIPYLIWESDIDFCKKATSGEALLDQAFTYTPIELAYEFGTAGYSFVLPRCAREVIRAAIEMDNHLANYCCNGEIFSNSIFVFMKREGQTLAVIEVRDGKVFGVHTRFPFADRDVVEAFCAWQNGVRII